MLGGLVASLALVGASPAVAEIRYLYDALGRLRSVTDDSQTDGTAIFIYDSVGNITSVIRMPASQVALIEFRPARGPGGTSVVLQGTGFSATPSANAVTFNGTAATVTSASPYELVVTVPAGATTGTIGVTAPGGSATSAEPFTVTADSGVPTITGFTPTIGPAGTSVSISGTNFETTPANNRLAFHQTRARVTTATATAMATTVPFKATSGRLSVATPAGTGTSSGDFFVPPSPYVAADVAFTDRMTLGGTKVVTIGTASRIGLVVFDGTAGQRISLQMTSVSIAFSSVKVFAPDGALLGPETFVNTGGGFSDVQTLPKTGTYQILVDPTSTNTGSMTLNLNNVPADVTGTLSAGSGLGITITTPGQNAKLTFSGTSGQRVSVRFTSVTVSSSFAYLDKPDGTSLVGATAVNPSAGGFIDAVTLPTTGTYTVRIDLQGTATGAMTVTAYDITDASGTITPGGSAVTASLTTPGQNGLYTFSGTASQRVSLNVNGISPSPASLNVSIKKPDGSNLVSPVFMGAAGAFIEPVTLPSSGTYGVFADPVGAYTGSATLTLANVPADGSGSITPGGSAVTVTISAAGQNASLAFSGTASQRISLRMTSVTITNSTVTIKKPDASTLASAAGIGTGGGYIDVQTLPTTGTYTIVVDPQGAATGSMTLTLYDVPADVSGSLTINGGGVGVTITTPGQNGALTFAGTASQQATVRITSNTIGSVSVILQKPDGSTLTSGSSGGTSFNLATQTLPTTGTYTVKMDPFTFGTGSLTVSVTSP
jgi:hypothetical protein